jgi:type 1 glutamine amidotransferase
MRGLLALILLTSPLAAQARLKALIVDGQNNHAWRETTPVLKRLLEETGRFTVDVATAPPKGADLSGFAPRFRDYAVVVSNYNGEPWPAATLGALLAYVAGGGGFVSYHAADNAFPESVEYNKMIGVGGWGNRDEKAGPYWVWRGDRLAGDKAPGRAGSHGARLPFTVTIRDAKHPITRGLPPVWMHAADELYAQMRGPGEKMRVLATAYSDPANRGRGEHEPMLMTIAYGRGRVFHTTLGHDVPAMQCVGFIATFQRGAEWAATGKVTGKAPADFPTADAVGVRK